MAKRVNYGFEKRQREMRKQKKNDEKAQRKLDAATDTAEKAGAEVSEGASKGSDHPERI
jgi:hypothetical protein